MTADTANLDELACAGAIPDQYQGTARGPGIVRDPEVRPVEVTMVPGRSPSWVEIEPEVRWLFTLVRMDRIERGGHHREMVRKDDGVEMAVQLHALVVMAAIGALGRLQPVIPV
jgi:hypothetical protein